MKDKIKFWRKHPNWFISFISELYPLTRFQLIQYEDVLNWNRVVSNPFIKWTDDLNICFSDKLQNAVKKEHVLCEVEGFPIIIDYQLEEPLFREDNAFPDYLEFWKDINFGLYWQPENYNEDAIMTLIKKFECSIELTYDNFDYLPIPTTMLEEEKDELDWDMLSGYWGLRWSFEFLQQFEDYWVTEKLIGNHTAFNYCLKDDLDDEFIEKVLS